MTTNIFFPKILVIDDEELDNAIFKMLINRVIKNSEVDIMVNGEEAIKKLLEVSKSNPELLPDFIFLDLKMPVMNGWQFLEEFERLNIDPLRKIQIYVLSSSVLSDDINKSLSNPLVEDFLSKPINLDKIRTIFEAA
jgi:CheY-like chemotaxis protein